VIGVDTHYETVNKTIEKVMPNPPIKFYTLIVKPKGRKRKRVKNTDVDPSNGITVLMQEQTVWNNQITHIRVCAESLFGLVKLKWKKLSFVFFKDLVQQNYFVFIIIRVFNYVLDKKYF
jgi:hypothetical protein